MADIGARIRALREERGMRQRDLAARVEIDPSALSKVESGRRSLAATEAARIAEALGVGLDQLLLDEQPVFSMRANADNDRVQEAMARCEAIIDRFLLLEAAAR